MKKVLLSVLVLILLALIVLAVYYFSGNLEKDDIGIIPAEATGSLDDIEEALSQEIEDMNNLLLEEDLEANLILSDDSIINDFGQSINEDEL